MSLIAKMWARLDRQPSDTIQEVIDRDPVASVVFFRMGATFLLVLGSSVVGLVGSRAGSDQKIPHVFLVNATSGQVMVDESQQAMEPKRMLRPYGTPGVIAKWAAMVVGEIGTFSFTDFDEHQQRIRHHFTKDGMDKYTLALKTAHREKEDLKRAKLVQTTVVNGMVAIGDKGIYPDTDLEYMVLHVPAIITYQGLQSRAPEHVSVEIIVLFSPESDESSYKAITSYKVMAAVAS